METTIYLIRHAQCRPSADVHFSKWPLSETGADQAQRLAELLPSLKIQKLFSSPFDRCLRTVHHFKEKAALDVQVHHDLREKYIEDGFAHMQSPDIWKKSWDDFDYRVHRGSESSTEAQKRIVKTIREIAEGHQSHTIGISTHGNVISLFFNHLDSGYKREQAETVRNPDVFKLKFKEKEFSWDQTFKLPGLDDIATFHSATKIHPPKS